MAFEINEIAIRMQVSESPQPGLRTVQRAGADESGAAADPHERPGLDPRLVEECVRQVLQVLRRQKER